MSQPAPLTPAEGQTCGAPQDTQPSSPAERPIDSQELLRGGRMIEIRHEGTVYRLQATRLGKLILTK